MNIHRSSCAVVVVKILFVPQEGLRLDAISISLQSDPSSSGTTAPDIGNTAAVPQVLIGEHAKGHLPHAYHFSKMGELLANMHCAHNDHILQRFLVGNNYTMHRTL